MHLWRDLTRRFRFEIASLYRIFSEQGLKDIRSLTFRMLPVFLSPIAILSCG